MGNEVKCERFCSECGAILPRHYNTCTAEAARPASEPRPLPGICLPEGEDKGFGFWEGTRIPRCRPADPAPVQPAPPQELKNPTRTCVCDGENKCLKHAAEEQQLRGAKGFGAEAESAPAPEPRLPFPPCADCGHVKDDPHFHFDAPGDNWGAALHWFRYPATVPPAEAPRPYCATHDVYGSCYVCQADEAFTRLSQAATPSPEPLLTPLGVAKKLANVGGVILQEWLDSYIARWKAEEQVWRDSEVWVPDVANTEFLLRELAVKARYCQQLASGETEMDEGCDEHDALVEIDKVLRSVLEEVNKRMEGKK